MKSGKSPSANIYSYEETKYVSFLGNGAGGYDYDAGAHVMETSSGLYHCGVGGHIQLSVDGSNIRGYDYDTGSHFIGSVNGSSVQIYDYGESKYFNYLA